VATEESARVLGKAMEHEYSLADLLRRPGVSYEALMGMARVDGAHHHSPEVGSTAGVSDFDKSVIEQVEIAAKYSGYIQRQQSEVERAATNEGIELPPDFDYSQVAALSIEVRQKLARFRPETLGLAGRISGVTPAAISLLQIHLKKGRLRKAKAVSLAE
jgi:tRNA uridine 5-carboxymethylaminomethyl modification enzyme